MKKVFMLVATMAVVVGLSFTFVACEDGNKNTSSSKYSYSYSSKSYSSSNYSNSSKSSSKSNHTCEECSADATYSYKSPFSGQTEWYCYKHYKELKELLEQFGMN